MPTWAGIEDATLNPDRVWLWREKETDPWKPLRKSDCMSLNDSKEQKVLVEGGRYTADKEEGTIKPNFFRGLNRYLTSAIWFIKQETNSKDKIALVPVIETLHEMKIEQLYQDSVKACSSFGEGIEAALQAEVPLGEDYKAVLVQNGNVLSLRKKPTKGWFGTVLELQRGYGQYVVKGEDVETKLGPVRHVIFVVHGIGEALWSRDEISMNSIATEMALLRENLQQRQTDEWKKQCEKAKREGQDVPKLPSRIEFVPVEWYDKIHGSSSTLMKTLDKATLSAVPAFRAIANHAVFDVLMYLTPAFCEQVLECVTSEITTYYNGFLEAHPDFLSNGGKVSLIGHSLGSVICWDLLSVLKENQEFQQEKPAGEKQPGMPAPHGVRRVESEGHGEIAYQAYATHEDANQGKTGTWGPSLPKPMKETIPFTPDYTIFLGSPLGMFLTLRGAHAVFDEMREAAIFAIADKIKDSESSSSLSNIEIPLTSPFTLPSKCIYNIFHPSDPVAYRIEPLLMSRDMEIKNLPPPMYLTSRGQDVRLHVKAKQVGDEIGRLFKGEGVLPFGVISQVVTSVSKMGNEDLRRRTSSLNTMEGLMSFALGGTNTRIDFQLQHGVIDNEYLSAVTAHSTYFTNSDFRDFLCYLAELDN